MAKRKRAGRNVSSRYTGVHGAFVARGERTGDAMYPSDTARDMGYRDSGTQWEKGAIEIASLLPDSQIETYRDKLKLKSDAAAPHKAQVKAST